MIFSILIALAISALAVGIIIPLWAVAILCKKITWSNLRKIYYILFKI